MPYQLFSKKEEVVGAMLCLNTTTAIANFGATQIFAQQAHSK
jgi:hypothetical protein